MTGSSEEETRVFQNLDVIESAKIVREATKQRKIQPSATLRGPWRSQRLDRSGSCGLESAVVTLHRSLGRLHCLLTRRRQRSLGHFVFGKLTPAIAPLLKGRLVLGPLSCRYVLGNAVIILGQEVITFGDADFFTAASGAGGRGRRRGGGRARILIAAVTRRSVAAVRFGLAAANQERGAQDCQNQKTLS